MPSPPPAPVPTHSVLYLGSGNFSSPLRMGMANSHPDAAHAKNIGSTRAGSPRGVKLNRGFILWATEVQTKEGQQAQYAALDRKYGTHQKEEYDHTCLSLLLMGAEVKWSFDGTRFPRGTPAFDHIIFENPHSGTYGQQGDSVKDMSCVVSNTALLANVMTEASKHLNHGGIFELHVSGWPYLARGRNKATYDEGMKLNDTAAATAFGRDNGRLALSKIQELGTGVIQRNNGQPFEATVVRLIFVKP